MIPGQEHRRLTGGHVTAVGLPNVVPSVYRANPVPALPMGVGNALTRVSPVVGHSGLAYRRNALAPPPVNAGGVGNVPLGKIYQKQTGTRDLTNGVGTAGMGMGIGGDGMSGVSGVSGMGARNWDTFPDPQMAQDVSEIFEGQTHMPAPTTLVMPNIVATAWAGLGAYTNITPMSLNQRMPSIVSDTPQDLNAAAHSTCNALDAWVSQNEALAAAVLVGIAYLMFKR